MALTRKMLKALGIDEDKIEHIIDAHTDSLEALKRERDSYKNDSEQLAAVQKELNGLKANGGDWQSKYEKEHSDFEAYKNDVTAKETKRAKEQAFRDLLKNAGVSDKRLDAVIKVTNLDNLEVDKDGKIKDADKHTETIKAEWSDFIETTTTTGANTPAPPTNNSGGKMTKAEIYKKDDKGKYVLSTEERQKALINNRIQ